MRSGFVGHTNHQPVFVLRGKRAQFAHHDPRPCLIPPDWSKGYTSTFAVQQEESENLVAR